ncbi:virulence-associated protein [Diaphorobacter sp. HDW4A]|uniref:virulence-associated protein n=1 Tax=Diaphorobacter sp. HDW4A TaxID=2714924 RepID=UPI0014077E4A|nr:virulence-associated protein [Diaphorobacter sp. HDW4A]QIL80816.1 virulence-associated protein [Diaphorobacter sp. HDW4A]QIL83587.1 virulence-associated protein [Diaphorobacter sp. HDW4A]
MSFDSIVQIITPTAVMQCAGANLFFAAAGGDVLVSMCMLDENGQLGNVMARARLGVQAIKTNGEATRCLWDAPVLVSANVPLALVVDASDTITSVHVGQYGEQNQTGGWVTAPQATIGTYWQTNASGITTRYANRMLRFELLAVRYTEQNKTLIIGSQAVVNATSLMVNAGAQQPASDARITYKLELLTQAGAVVRSMDVDSGQTVQLSEPHTGTARLSATMRVGASGLGAVLEPGTVLAVGSLLESGTYITPAIASSGGTDLRVIFEGDIPGGSGVMVEAQLNDAGAWVAVPWESSSAQTAGVIELHHRKQAINAQSLRLRLTLSGTTTARPKVRNLRAVIL